MKIKTILIEFYNSVLKNLIEDQEQLRYYQSFYDQEIQLFIDLLILHIVLQELFLKVYKFLLPKKWIEE